MSNAGYVYSVPTINFGTGIQDALRMVREDSQMRAILSTEERFGVIPLSTAVELQHLVIAAGDEQLALVVKVEGRRCSSFLGILEELSG